MEEELTFANVLQKFISCNDSLTNFTPLLDTKDFLFFLLRNFIPNLQNFVAFINSEKTQEKFLCAGNILKGDISWKCFDCGFENESHIICDKCFQDGDHKGHRIQPSVERSGCCDCGDIGALEEFGFCSKHRGDEIRISSINIPSEFVDGLREYVYESIYLYASSSENLLTGISDDEKINMKAFANLSYIAFFNLTSIFSTKSYNLLFYITKMLQECFPDSPKFYLKHDCGNLEDNILGEKKKCKCTLLELIFRFNLSLSNEIQDWSEKSLFSYFPDSQFKSFLSKIFTKFLHFIIKCKYKQILDREKSGNIQDMSESPEFFQDSSLRTIYTQFFSDNLKKTWISCPQFRFLLDILKNALNCLNTNSYKGGYMSFINIINLNYFLQSGKKKPDYLYIESNYLDQLLDVLLDPTDFKELDLISAKFLLHCYAVTVNMLCDSLEVFVPNNNNDEVKRKKLENLISQSVSFMNKRFDFINKNFELFKYPYLVCLVDTQTKTFCSLLGIYYSYYNQHFDSFIQNLKTQHPYFDSNNRFFFTMKTIQMIYIKFPKIPNSNFEFSKFLKPDFEELYLYYNWNNLSGSFFDILFLQFILRTCEPSLVDQLIQFTIFNIDPILAKNQDCYSEASIFLKNILTLCFSIDIPLIICNSFFKGQNPLLDVFNQPLQNLISSFFIIQNYYDYPLIKQKLKQYGILKDVSFDKQLKNIVNVDSETKRLYLKPEFQSIYEPFNFLFSQKVSNEIITKIDEFKKSETLDSIVGNSPIKQNNLLSFEILLRLSNSDFSSYILTSISNFNSSNDISLSLKFLYECLFMKKFNKMQTKCSEFFISKANKLTESLSQIEQRCDVSLAYSIKKVKELLNELTPIDLNKFESENKQIPKKASEDSKREEYLQKVAKLKSQFTQKQKEFLEKSEENRMEEFGEKDKAQIQNKCIFCHMPQTDPKNFLGFISYASVDNLNSYSNIHPEEQINVSLITCGHFLHYNCYIEHFIHKKPANFHSIYKPEATEFEYHCPFCKFYSNYLLPSLDLYFKQWFKVPQKIDFQQIQSLKSVNEIIEYTSNLFSLNIEQEIIKELDNFVILENFGISSVSESSEFHDQCYFMLLGIFGGFVDQTNDENFTLKFFIDSLFLFNEFFSIDNISDFISKKGEFYRNCFALTKLCYISFDSQSKTDFMNYYKARFINQISGILFNKNESLVEYIHHFDLRITKIFWLSFLLFNFDLAFSITSYIFKLSIEILKSVYLFAFNVTGEIDTKIQYMLDGFLERYYNLISCLYIITANMEESSFSVNFNFKEPKEIEKLIYQSKNILNVDANLELMIEKAFNLQNLSIESKSQFIDYLSTNNFRKFSMTQLGKHYLETNNQIMQRKCCHCGYFPKKTGSVLAICLLCGEVYCSAICSEKSKIGQKLVGNLFFHSKTKHEGACLYVETLDSEVMAMDSHFSGFNENLYFDSLGQTFNRNSVNWKDFELDRYKLLKFEQIAINRMIPQYLFRLRLNNPGKVAFTDRI